MQLYSVRDQSVTAAAGDGASWLVVTATHIQVDLKLYSREGWVHGCPSTVSHWVTRQGRSRQSTTFEQPSKIKRNCFICCHTNLIRSDDLTMNSG